MTTSHQHLSNRALKNKDRWMRMQEPMKRFEPIGPLTINDLDQ